MLHYLNTSFGYDEVRSLDGLSGQMFLRSLGVRYSTAHPAINSKLLGTVTVWTCPKTLRTHIRQVVGA